MEWNISGDIYACDELKEPRTKMSVYMKSIRIKLGYVSLKVQYMEQQQRNFPALGKTKIPDAYENMIEDVNTEEDDSTLLVNEKDTKIVALEKTISDIPVLKENLKKMQAELRREKKTTSVALNKLKFARKVTEKSLAESLPETPSDQKSHLIVLYSSLLNEDEFEFDLATDSLKHKEGFLKEVEENCDISDPKNQENITLLKNRVLQRIKETKERRISRRDSISTNGSRSDSKKRISKEINPGGDTIRHRAKSPVSKLL